MRDSIIGERIQSCFGKNSKSFFLPNLL
jgi:hypothetical protein